VEDSSHIYADIRLKYTKFDFGHHPPQTPLGELQRG